MLLAVIYIALRVHQCAYSGLLVQWLQRDACVVLGKSSLSSLHLFFLDFFCSGRLKHTSLWYPCAMSMPCIPCTSSAGGKRRSSMTKTGAIDDISCGPVASLTGLQRTGRSKLFVENKDTEIRPADHSSVIVNKWMETISNPPHLRHLNPTLQAQTVALLPSPR